MRNKYSRMPLLPRCLNARHKIAVTPDKYARDAELWLTHGNIVYRAARCLYDQASAEPTLYFPAATLAHTSLELLMKGTLISEGMISFNPEQIKRLPKGLVIKKKDCVWGHSLIQLAGKLAERTSFDLREEMKHHDILHQPPFSVRAALEYFEPFFSELRYPRGLEQVMDFGGGDELILEELVVRIIALKRS